jgi:hypothetical protein
MRQFILAMAFLASAPPALAQDSDDGNLVIQLPDATEPVSLADDEVGDHHDGYYYPAPQSVETYPSTVATLPDSDKLRRQGFVIGVVRQLTNANYAPSYSLFAKGERSQKLIIIGLRDGELNTIYRARALFATLTQIARATPFFQKNTQPEESNFFDLLKLLGFTQLTISDGNEFTHQVIIE